MSELPCSKVPAKRKWVTKCKSPVARGTWGEVKKIMEFVLLEAGPSREIVEIVVAEKQRCSLALEDSELNQIQEY